MKILKLGMIFKHLYQLWLWNWFVNAPTSASFKTHKTFDMQAEEHDLIKYAVLAYIYLILSEFRAPKMAPFLPSFLTTSMLGGS